MLAAVVGLLAGQATQPPPPDSASAREEVAQRPTEAVSETPDPPSADDPGADPDPDADPDADPASEAQTTPPDAERRPMASPGVARASGATVAVVPVRGPIYGFTRESLERRVDRALQAGASVIVIEFDTPGGLLDAALDISKYIKSIPVDTVAWINDQAYSAGILLAAACDQIVMAPASATGDCAPINILNSNMGPTERGKALIPLLTEFRDSARRNGYDYALFHAMCTVGVEVYVVEHAQTGERRLVNQVDYAVMVRGESLDDADRLDLDQAVSEESFARVAQPSLTVATDGDRGAWRPVEKLPSGEVLPMGRLWDGNAPLTLDQTIAHDIGLAKAIVADTNDLQQFLNAASVSYVAETWSYGAAAVLTSWWMRAILVAVLIIGAYVELQAPGLGVPGLLAVVAAALLLGAPYVIGLAEVWHLIVFLIGAMLLVVELVLIPSFGLVGTLGLLLMLLGLAFSVVPSGSGSGPLGLPPPELWGQVLRSTVSIILGLTAGTVGVYFVTRHFGRVPVLNRLVLTDDTVVSEQEAARLGVPGTHVSGDQAVGAGEVQVGQTGRALNRLRPAGQAEFDGHVVDVVSVGNWIEADRPVRVVEVHGNRIVVDVTEAT